MLVDETEFEQIVGAHYESLYRFALTLAQNEADACDLTQDTFFVWATKGGLVRDKSKTKSWLFTTLRRKFLGARRHDTRFPHYEVGAAEYQLPTISPASVYEMDAGVVISALMQVDEIYRAPLTLLYLEDHSYRDIAEILEIPIGTVMSRISRGKMLLREKLADPASHPTRKFVPLPDDAAQRKFSP